jgi:hypothetical protein
MYFCSGQPMHFFDNYIDNLSEEARKGMQEHPLAQPRGNLVQSLLFVLSAAVYNTLGQLQAAGAYWPLHQAAKMERPTVI